MRKSLIAQSVAAVISGLGLVAAANAAVVGPDPNGGAPVAVAGTAAATQLVVNTDNIGHINLVPYYSVQNGNTTLVNIVNNDTKNGKAVKVRFRGASNSDDVFDFTVLMSPGDKFVFGVAQDTSAGAAGYARVVSVPDVTCTLGGPDPGINVIKDQNFIGGRLKPALSETEKATETREGYIEILNMADIPPNLAAGSLFQTIKHKSISGVWKAACDQAILTAAVGSTPTSYADATSRGLAVPTTGLSTNWTIINVPSTLTYSGVAVAVEARTTPAAPLVPQPGYGNIVFHAQIPSTKDAAGNELQNEILTSDPVLNVDGRVKYANYDFPDLSTPYLNKRLTTAAGAGILTAVAVADGGTPTAVEQAPQQALDLTMSLAKSSVANEFFTDLNFGGATDWVFSMPTRRYNVAVQYAGVPTAAFTTDTIQVQDFGAGKNFFSKTAVTGNVAFGAGVVGEPAWQICVTGLSFQAADDTALVNAPRTGPATYDNEELATNDAGPSSPFVISPGVPNAPQVLKFCGEVSVFKFNTDIDTPNASSAKVAVRSIGTTAKPLPYKAGWIRVATPGLTGDAFTAQSGATTNGLPVIGSALIKLKNDKAAAGVSGNYGQSFEHKSTRP